MSENKVVCFLPCRKGSERVPRKNTKPFAGVAGGLLEIKLNQLIDSRGIDEIVLSTNDAEIIAFAEAMRSPKLHVHCRDESLAGSETSTDEVIGHALGLIMEGHMLWTHVTSPFVTAAHYDAMLARYFEALDEGHDSLMTTTSCQGFFWYEGQPVNYDRRVEKWPRTQTLSPVHEVNSAAFIAPVAVCRALNDRIGKRPFLFGLDKVVGHDIDWPEDFALAECMLEKGLAEL